jgi:alpha-D-ribose 1-methylphosphonate 5-triphosphate diphosphatase
MIHVRLTGAKVLGSGDWEDRALSIENGMLAKRGGTEIDLRGYRLLPGIVDIHGDGFERHVAPRRGAMKDVGEGIRAAEAEMAANGITTGVMAQFWSWEGGIRSPDFATAFFDALAATQTITDLRGQMRFETYLLDTYDELPDMLARWGIGYLVFNDHLPHDRLAKGQMPKRNTAEALRAGRSPEKHFQYQMDMHARKDEVPGAIAALAKRLAALGVRMGSHDDNSAEQRAWWMAQGVEIAEFPETLEAAEAPGDVILGAPNLVRGGSHKGNVSALDVIIMGHADALASDYHYPSLRRAALFLAKTIGISEAWALVSSGPARLLGLADRGRIEPGLRADLLILVEHDRVAATISGGRVSYISGPIVERFCA